MGHFCLQPVDRAQLLSDDYNPGEEEFRQFADLTQIAELMMRQLTSANNPLVDGIGRSAHSAVRGILPEPEPSPPQHRVLLLDGPRRYLMAAVGKRARMMKLMAAEFGQYLFHLANLHRNLQQNRYLIRTDN